jgi:hypothetical protein
VDQLLSVEEAQLRREAREARQARRSRQPRPSMSGVSGIPEVARGDSPIIWTRGDNRAVDLDLIVRGFHFFAGKSLAHMMAIRMPLRLGHQGRWAL